MFLHASAVCRDSINTLKIQGISGPLAVVSGSVERGLSKGNEDTLKPHTERSADYRCSCNVVIVCIWSNILDLIA